MYKVLRMEIHCHTKKSGEEWIFDEQKSETSCLWIKSTKYLSLIQPSDHKETDAVYTKYSHLKREWIGDTLQRQVHISSCLLLGKVPPSMTFCSSTHWNFLPFLFCSSAIFEKRVGEYVLLGDWVTFLTCFLLIEGWGPSIISMILYLQQLYLFSPWWQFFWHLLQSASFLITVNWKHQ